MAKKELLEELETFQNEFEEYILTQERFPENNIILIVSQAPSLIEEQTNNLIRKLSGENAEGISRDYHNQLRELEKMLYYALINYSNRLSRFLYLFKTINSPEKLGEKLSNQIKNLIVKIEISLININVLANKLEEIMKISGMGLHAKKLNEFHMTEVKLLRELEVESTLRDIRTIVQKTKEALIQNNVQ